MNELKTMEIDGLVADLTTRQTSFCSLTATTPEEKAKLFNLMNAPQHRLSDMINMSIEVTDIFVETVQCANKDGEIILTPRIVLIDKNGEGYQCVSMGIYGALKKLFSIYGTPHWEEPLSLTVKQVTKGEYKILTLAVSA